MDGAVRRGVLSAVSSIEREVGKLFYIDSAKNRWQMWDGWHNAAGEMTMHLPPLEHAGFRFFHLVTLLYGRQTVSAKKRFSFPREMNRKDLSLEMLDRQFKEADVIDPDFSDVLD